MRGWNQASAEQNKYVPASPGFCGGNCEGVYELKGGAVTRQSPAPFDCGAQPCASEELYPRVGPDGAISYLYQLTVSERNGASWHPITGQQQILSRDSAGATRNTFQTACEGQGASGKTVTDASAFAVDPTSADHIFYADCQETDDADCPLSYTKAYDVFSSGAQPATASDDVKVQTLSDASANCFLNARDIVADVDVSPDAKRLVEVVGGPDGGVLLANADGSGQATRLLAFPPAWSFFSARFISGDRIALSAGPSSSSAGGIRLYSVPLSCTPSTCDVNSATGMTIISGDQTLSSDYELGTAAFGYTSSTATITALGAQAGGGGDTSGGGGSTSGGGSTGGGGDTGGGGGDQSSGTVTAQIAPVATQHRSRLARKGLSLKVSCPAGACALKATATLGRHKLGSTTSAMSSASPHRIHIAFGRAAARRLRKARHQALKVKVVATDAAGHSATTTATIKYA